MDNKAEKKHFIVPTSVRNECLTPAVIWTAMHSGLYNEQSLGVYCFGSVAINKSMQMLAFLYLHNES